MRINKYLKTKRTEKGLSDSDFAEITGQNIHWVEDLDGDEDELNGLTIPQFRNMCLALDIEPHEVFSVVASDLMELGLFELIRKRREEKFWTVDDLADRIGYEAYIVEAIENGASLDGVCIDALKKMATELDLPLDFVLHKLGKLDRVAS